MTKQTLPVQSELWFAGGLSWFRQVTVICLFTFFWWTKCLL